MLFPPRQIVNNRSLPCRHAPRPSAVHDSVAAQVCPEEDDWVSTDFEVGDVLTFPCFTVHRGMAGTIKNRVRLSYDARFQPLSEPVEAGSLLPNVPLAWDELYEGWEIDDLKYYWKDLPLEVVKKDPNLNNIDPRICGG